MEGRQLFTGVRTYRKIRNPLIQEESFRYPVLLALYEPISALMLQP